MLRAFKETTTEPISVTSFVLETPLHKKVMLAAKDDQPTDNSNSKRKSPRLKEKLVKGKTIVKIAQELVAKKCGVLQEEEEMDNMTLRQYINMYKKPLEKESMEAIMQLTEVAQEKKMKNKEKKKKKKKKQGFEGKKKELKKGKAAPAAAV